MEPLLREALVWIGSAVLIALVVFLWAALAMPGLDDLANRSSVS